MTMPARIPVGAPPPFDPELAAVLAEVGGTVPTSVTVDMIPELRELRNRMAPSHEELRRGGAFEVEELSVPGPAGAPEVPLLVCRPTGAVTPLPVVYFIHGGGMVLGNNRQGVPNVLDWAQELPLVVVSVEYRLAPEHPHPAPLEDCYAGLVWTVEHATELGVDPARIVIAGTSAGGGLAAGVALLARDRGGPALAGQVLMCPMIDDRNDTPSSTQMTGRGVWDHTSNDTGWTALLGPGRAGPNVSSYAAPARADDLTGLPPAFIDVGSAETFRDEDVAYATQHLAGRRPCRAPRLARRLPRIRPRRPAGNDLPGRQGGPGALAAQAVGDLIPHPTFRNRQTPPLPLKSGGAPP